MNFVLICRSVFKALRLLWPYLRSAIFKDRTVTEVIKENQHLTWMLVLIMMLVFALVIATIRLSELKEEIAAKQKVSPETSCLCVDPFEAARLNDLMEEGE